MLHLSQTENRILMQHARESLRGLWGLAIGTIVVYILIVIAVESIPRIGWLIYMLIAGPLTLGLTIFSLALSRNNSPRFEMLFDGFQNYAVALATFLLEALFVFLWMLLLIVPGIIAAMAYSQAFFLLAEDKTLTPMDALAKSKQLMEGNKWKLFCLCWRFFGWALLSILTVGIGFLFLVPYMQVSFAKFYDDIPKTGAESAGMPAPSGQLIN